MRFLYPILLCLLIFPLRASEETDGYKIYISTTEKYKGKLGLEDRPKVQEQMEIFSELTSIPLHPILSTYLEDVDPLYDQLEQAVNAPEWSFKIDETTPIDLMLPELGPTLSLAKIAALKIRYSSSTEALRYFTIMLRLSKKMQTSGPLVSVFTAYATESIVTLPILDHIEKLSVEEQQALIALLNEHYARLPDYRKLWSAEKYFIGKMLELNIKLVQQHMVPATKQEKLQFDQIMSDWHLFLSEGDIKQYLKVIDYYSTLNDEDEWAEKAVSKFNTWIDAHTKALDAAASKDLDKLELQAEFGIKEDERQAALKLAPYLEMYSAKKELNDTQRKEAMGLVKEYAYSYLIGETVGILSGFENHRRYYASQIKLLAIYTATELFKKQNGKLPYDLTELVEANLIPKALTICNISRQQFLTRKDDNSIIFYSVGRDLEDDGGTQWDNLTNDENSDLVLLLNTIEQ